MVKGQPEHHPEGVYALRFLRGSKPAYEEIGQDPAQAIVAKRKKETLLQAKADGIALVPPTEAASPKTSGLKRLMRAAMDKYIADTKAHKARRTYNAYALVLNLFDEFCEKKYLEDVDRDDLLAFIIELRAKGLAPRTVANRIRDLKIFFANPSVQVPWPLAKKDKPRFTEKLVAAYSKEDLMRLFAAADREEYELFQFFLCTGGREQEVEFATWRDVNLTEGTFHVCEKLDLKYTPKDKEEGYIPIPDSVVTLLGARRGRYPGTRLIFPTKEGKPDGICCGS
jgi:integrase